MANLYDMMRSKAKEMGHAAANAPDAVIAKVLDTRDRSQNLAIAKLTLQQYMLGEMEPREMAQWMANNPDVRLAMSDLCRMRLEPREFNVKRGDGYIDVGAGVKTFWTEMTVPLPSERDAARDLLNINYGIDAARQANVQAQENGQSASDSAGEQSKPVRKTFRDLINEAKQNAARKAIDTLTPLAEGKQAKPATENMPAVQIPNTRELNEQWFETEEGRLYHDNATRRIAQQVENISAAIEARISPDIAADVQHNQAAALRSGYTRDELNQPLNDNMNALFEQIAQHMGQEVKRESEGVKDAMKEDAPVKFSRQKGKIVGEFEGKKVRFKESFKDHVFTDEEAAALLRGDDIVVDYTDKNDDLRQVAGKLEWQVYAGRKFLGFKADFSKEIEHGPNEKIPDAGENKPEISSEQAAETQKVLSSKWEQPADTDEQERQPSASEMRDLFGNDVDYYEQMAKDMQNYVPDDQPVLELDESDLQFGQAQDEGMKLSK